MSAWSAWLCGAKRQAAMRIAIRRPVVRARSDRTTSDYTVSVYLPWPVIIDDNILINIYFISSISFNMTHFPFPEYSDWPPPSRNSPDATRRDRRSRTYRRQASSFTLITVSFIKRLQQPRPHVDMIVTISWILANIFVTYTRFSTRTNQSSNVTSRPETPSPCSSTEIVYEKEDSEGWNSSRNQKTDRVTSIFRLHAWLWQGEIAHPVRMDFGGAADKP